MTLKEAKQVLNEYLAKGESEEDLVGALYVMYQNDDINLEELEKLIGLLGYEFTEEFKAMSDEDKKTKGYTEDKDAEDLPEEKVEIKMLNPKEVLKMTNNKINYFLKMFYNGGHPWLEGNEYIKDYLVGKTDLLPEGIIDEIKKANKKITYDI